MTNYSNERSGAAIGLLVLAVFLLLLMGVPAVYAIGGVFTAAILTSALGFFWGSAHTAGMLFQTEKYGAATGGEDA